MPRFSMILPETVLQDLHYGTRVLYRNRGFTTVAVLALALGIGVNTAAFTAYKAMVTRALDARDPGTMVNLAVVRDAGVTAPSFSYPDYEQYRDHLNSFSGVIAQSPEHLALSGAGAMVSQRSAVAGSLFGRLGLLPPGARNAEFVSVFIVSENYFSVLGVASLRGRTFEGIGTRELSASPTVLISENYWQKRFAGNPAVLGKTIQLNGSAFTIAGITPHNFVGTSVFVPDFWLPFSLEPLVHANGSWLHNRDEEHCRLFGRLSPGVGVKQAQTEMTLLIKRLRAAAGPGSESKKAVSALVWPGSPFPLPIEQYGGIKFAALLIMVAAAMVLAVACFNVASLQLARATSRQKELGMRLSLGAGRWRLVQQLLTESALLGVLAGACALPLTWALTEELALKFAEALPPDQGTVVFHVTPDLAVFLYVFAISLVAGVLFGLTPAIESSRSALSAAFKAHAGSSPVGSRRMRDLLIAVQVAVSLVLMIAASMFVHGAIRSLNTETGYDGKHVVDLQLQFPADPRYTAARKVAIVRELRSRLAGRPGVAAISSARPPDDFSFLTAAVALGGTERAAGKQASLLHYSYVQANYFQTLGIPLLLGHGFRSGAGEAERAVIISESAGRQLWPGQNPMGRSVRLGAIDERFHNQGELRADGPAYQVVGVARDTRGIELDGSDSKRVYLPSPGSSLADWPILIRTRSQPEQVMNALVPVISSVDPNLVVSSSTLEEMLRRAPSFGVSTFAAAFASTVGLLGLALAGMGIYGTVSYVVVLRTREVGIRIAIGAQRRDVLGLIFRESTRPVFAGLLMGVLLAVGASYLLRGVLYGVNIVDGISFIGMVILFLAIALLASYPPARRAMRVDPMVALRYE